MPSPHRPSPRRWAALTIATLLGLACVALLLAGGRASAAPPDVPAPPLAALPGPARLAPAAQLTPTICPRDVVVVLDRSHSMDFDTICFNCYQRTVSPPTTPGSSQAYISYPSNGVRYPVVSSTVSSNLCAGVVIPITYPITGTQYHYQNLEAELYSFNSSTWERRYRTTGQGYWTINRDQMDTYKVPKPIDPTSGTQTSPGEVSHYPFVTFTDNTTTSPLFGRFYSLSDAQSGIAPRLEYDFALPAVWNSNTAYIWIRPRQGRYSGWSKQLDGMTNGDALYWAVNDGTLNNADGLGVNNESWYWVKLGSASGLAKGDAPYTWHTLKLWAGSPGYTIDRILITDNPGTPTSAVMSYSPNSDSRNQFVPGTPERYTWTTPGSAHRQACDPCNPIYGLNITDPGTQCLGYYPLVTPTNNLDNDLFGDNYSIRGSKEAVKAFVARLDPELDQVGFVYFNETAVKASGLMCRRRYGTSCYQGTGWGWPGGPAPYTFTTILDSVEDQTVSGSTCTGCGLRAGLEVLGINVDDRPTVNNLCAAGPFDSACGRGAAATQAMILVTDGTPNVIPNPSYGCDNDPNLWPDGGAPHDCGIYYAQKAAEAGVVIYTIGLGVGVDSDFLQAIAAETGGQYYAAAYPGDLPVILDDIISSTTTTACSPSGLSMAANGAQTGLPGQSLVYTHILTNQNYYSVTAILTFSADPITWQANISPTSQVLGPGQAVTVTAAVTVPPGNMEGEVGVVRVIVALQGDEAISATVADTTSTGLLRGVDVEPSQAAGGLPGQVVTYTHLVANTGNGLAAEVFTIDVVSGLWTPTWQPPTVSLAAGASAPLTVTLLIPPGTPSGTQHVLTVTVINQADPDTVFDAVADTTTVEWSPSVYLPIVLKGSQVWTQK